MVSQSYRQLKPDTGKAGAAYEDSMHGLHVRIDIEAGQATPITTDYVTF